MQYRLVEINLNYVPEEKQLYSLLTIYMIIKDFIVQRIIKPIINLL